MAMRICSICGAEMVEGYCYGDGLRYYCSDECLHHDFSPEEWELAYDNDEGYWTDWYDEMMYRVDAVSPNGVIHPIRYYPTYEAAEEFCKTCDWRIYIPGDGEVGGTWLLNILEPRD